MRRIRSGFQFFARNASGSSGPGLLVAGAILMGIPLAGGSPIPPPGDGPPLSGSADPAPPVAVQVPRDLMVQHWERQREIVLSYVDAMPEEHFGFRPTPGVRTFAQQIEHIIRDHVAIVSTVFGRDDAPIPGDRERYLSRKDALRAHVETGYDYVLGLLDETSEEELLTEGEVFGRYRVTRWHALSGALEHGTWTLGQVVPYLRLNGLEPPPYIVFPLSTQVGERSGGH
jgi:uncharacterized damage-inducible protein DinB